MRQAWRLGDVVGIPQGAPSQCDRYAFVAGDQGRAPAVMRDRRQRLLHVTQCARFC